VHHVTTPVVVLVIRTVITLFLLDAVGKVIHKGLVTQLPKVTVYVFHASTESIYIVCVIHG
jgi:hypothetical protein